MPIKTIEIPIKTIINILKDLDDKAKAEIFEKVFIEEEVESLSKGEKGAIIRAEQEFKKGATVKWPFGK